MRTASKTRRLLTASTLLLIAVSCASRSASTVPASGPASPSVAPVEQVWVAVLGAAEVPSDLSAERTAVLEALGDALEGSVVASPVGCLEGLPPALPADGYVLAIQQGSRAAVAVLAAELPEEPLFIGPVHVLCTD